MATRQKISPFRSFRALVLAALLVLAGAMSSVAAPPAQQPRLVDIIKNLRESVTDIKDENGLRHLSANLEARFESVTFPIRMLKSAPKDILQRTEAEIAGNLKSIGVEVLQKTSLGELSVEPGASPVQYKGSTVVFQCSHKEQRFSVMITLNTWSVEPRRDGSGPFFEGQLCVFVF